MKREIEVASKKISFTCDVCGSSDDVCRICDGCKRDLCDTCAVTGVDDIFDNDHYGNLSMCKSCYAILETVREAVQGTHDLYNLQIEQLRKEFDLSCKAKLRAD